MNIPSGISRVPTSLSSRIGLNNINRTNVGLLKVQQQIASGKMIERVSDDSVRAAIVGILDDRLERTGQIERNLTHANSSLGVLDSTLNEISTLGLEAQSLAAEQMSITSTASERSSQAVVVEQMIQSLFNSANREGVAGFVFGGSVTGRAPMEAFLGGYRYRGEGSGMVTDMGLAAGVPLTVGGAQAIAGTSSRIRGDVDLDPGLTGSTLLRDLVGARGLAVNRGTISMTINSTDTIRVDLGHADSIADVIDGITGAIKRYEDQNSVSILGPGGISTLGGTFVFDMAAGMTVEFSDESSGTMAEDLGFKGIQLSNANTTTTGIDVKLNWQSRVADLKGLLNPLGSLRVSNGGRSADIDLSQAQTLGDIKNLIEGAQLGVRVNINAAGNGIDVVNELSTHSAQALSISEVIGDGQTASLLGIRSFSASTRIADFNFGRGVSIVDGVPNPVTNQIDPALNSDFAITLGNAAGTRIMIDLRPQDMTTVSTVLARINDQIQSGLSAAGLPADSLSAGISSYGNGLTLRQSPSFSSPIRVEMMNNSSAAGDLGLLAGSYDAGAATFTGEDRAKVRVDSMFTHLLDLRAALSSNDVSGMRLAHAGLEKSLSSVAELRGLVGSYAQRVEAAQERESDRKTLDLAVRSELSDTDYTEASTRFSLLQTQLQAGLQATSMAGRMSLLDFLR
jgi:flagellin-like hook-associated protein FlgL